MRIRNMVALAAFAAGAVGVAPAPAEAVEVYACFEYNTPETCRQDAPLSTDGVCVPFSMTSTEGSVYEEVTGEPFPVDLFPAGETFTGNVCVEQ